MLRRKILLTIIVLLCFTLVACGGSSQPGQSVSPDLVDNASVYLNDEDGSVRFLYVTVKQGGKYTFDDVEADIHRDDDFEPLVEVLLQEGSSKGPAAGYWGHGFNAANATIEIRGFTARIARQKSFKIRLNREVDLWNGFRTIDLNKHSLDLTRVRNKLSFDYFEIIPHMNSLRTQFVNLHVKDLTGAVPDQDFVDYGLFTLVEQPNRLFLRTRGLDINGHLYKAEFFEFREYPGHLRNSDDPDYDQNTFEEILDIRGNEDHGKLLAMLADVNNYDLDINDIVDKHFNRNNYLTWLAVNILFDNIDTNAQNFFLYSPSDIDTWYFLPWDYDGTWGRPEQKGRDRAEIAPPWQRGISTYWAVVLHQRFFQDPNNLQALIAKMESLLATTITPDRTTGFLNSYYPVVSEFVAKPPDVRLTGGATFAEFETEFWRIVDEPEKNLIAFHEALENPMPVFLDVPASEGGKLVFRWSESYDFQGDRITYDLQISRAPEFSSIVYERRGLTGTEVIVEPLAAGDYYWRVIIYDEQGNEQMAFDVHRAGFEGLFYEEKFYGVRSFTI